MSRMPCDTAGPKDTSATRAQPAAPIRCDTWWETGVWPGAKQASSTPCPFAQAADKAGTWICVI